MGLGKRAAIILPVNAEEYAGGERFIRHGWQMQGQQIRVVPRQGRGSLHSGRLRIHLPMDKCLAESGEHNSHIR